MSVENTLAAAFAYVGPAPPPPPPPTPIAASCCCIAADDCAWLCIMALRYGFAPPAPPYAPSPAPAPSPAVPTPAALVYCAIKACVRARAPAAAALHCQFR